MQVPGDMRTPHRKAPLTVLNHCTTLSSLRLSKFDAQSFPIQSMCSLTTYRAAHWEVTATDQQHVYVLPIKEERLLWVSSPGVLIPSYELWKNNKDSFVTFASVVDEMQCFLFVSVRTCDLVLTCFSNTSLHSTRWSTVCPRSVFTHRLCDPVCVSCECRLAQRPARLYFWTMRLEGIHQSLMLSQGECSAWPPACLALDSL